MTPGSITVAEKIVSFVCGEVGKRVRASRKCKCKVCMGVHVCVGL